MERRKDEITSASGKLGQEVQEIGNLLKEKEEDVEEISFTGICSGILTIVCC